MTEEKNRLQIKLEKETENLALISALGLFTSRLKQAYTSKMFNENSAEEILELTKKIKDILNKK